MKGHVAVNSIQMMIYRKNFKMSPAAKKSYSTGQINNIINTDSQVLWQFIDDISIAIQIPFEFAYCAYFISYSVGWSIMPGVAIFLATWFINKKVREAKFDFF